MPQPTQITSEVSPDDNNHGPCPMQSIIQADPESHIFELTREQVDLLHHEAVYSQTALTHVWENPPNFADDMGYCRYKKPIFNSIVVDALLAHSLGKPVHYSRDKNGYGGVGSLGFGTVTNSIEFLAREGLIYDFHMPAHSDIKMQSFFLGTPKLQQNYGSRMGIWSPRLAFGDWGVEVTTRSHRAPDFYGTLIGKTRVKAKQEDFESVNTDLQAQNSFINNHKIDFKPPGNRVKLRVGVMLIYLSSKGREQTVNLAKTSQKRVFLKLKISSTDSFGGRFYGAFWQSLSGDDRKHITINDEAVGKELDYKSLHPNLAYCLAGSTPPDQIYGGKNGVSSKYGGRWRLVCKKALLIAFNAPNKSSASGALTTELIALFPHVYPLIEGDHKDEQRRKSACKDARKIINAVIKNNITIKRFICSDYGIRFQRIDSQMMAEVQRKCREEDIPVLGVHDSILVANSQLEKASEIFNTELEITKNLLKTRGLSAFGMG